MKFDKEFYRFTDAAKVLGITRHKLWRLQYQLSFETKVRGADKREKWIAAETMRMIHDYLNSYE